MKINTLALLALSVGLALSFAGCGGGSSGGDSSSGDGTPAESGTITLYVADAPSDDYESVILYISKVILLPPTSQSGRENVTIFESDDPEGQPVDLLKYRYQDFLLSVNGEITVGFYNKIRLVVTKVEAIGGPCEDNIKVPSGKVDLVVANGITIEAGKTIAIRLDVDVDKSFDLHVAGNSGMCIFRPIVFVEATPHDQDFKCPRLVKGTIDDLIYHDGSLTGLVLKLDGHRGTAEVAITSNTYIFDESGAAADPAALAEGQFVRLQGSLIENGVIDALLIVIGNVLDVSGMVLSDIDDQDMFDLKLDPGSALVGDSATVQVDQTLIMTGCDDITDRSAIVPWANVDVIGKYDLDADVLKAIAIMVEASRMEGQLVSIVDLAQGYNLEILPLGENETETVFLADAGSIYLGRDGNVSIALLQSLITQCSKTLYVSVKLLADPDDLEAERVTVKADRVTGVVRSIGSGSVLVLEDDQGNRVSIALQDSTKIIRQGDNGDESSTTSSIEEGDRLTVFGLYLCPNTGTADFLAFVIFLKPGNPPIFQIPDVITENDEIYMLPGGVYNNDLTVNGNNFNLSGNRVDNCGSPNQTTITGNVMISGNNATFRNITFTGDVIKKGNNTQFIDCCF